MPGVLGPATVTPASTVLPKSLSTSFTETLSYPLLAIQYHDATIERSLITDTVNSPRPIRSWALTKRLTITQLVALRNHYDAVDCGHRPFYFYDPLDVLPGQAEGSNWDGTGANTQGRVTVVMIGDWAESTALGRTDIPQIQMVEVL